MILEQQGLCYKQALLRLYFQGRLPALATRSGTDKYLFYYTMEYFNMGNFLWYRPSVARMFPVQQGLYYKQALLKLYFQGRPLAFPKNIRQVLDLANTCFYCTRKSFRMGNFMVKALNKYYTDFLHYNNYSNIVIRLNHLVVSAPRWQHGVSDIFCNFYFVKNHKNVNN